MPSFEGNRGTKKMIEPCQITKYFDDFWGTWVQVILFWGNEGTDIPLAGHLPSQHSYIGPLAAFGRHIGIDPR